MTRMDSFFETRKNLCFSLRREGACAILLKRKSTKTFVFRQETVKYPQERSRMPAPQEYESFKNYHAGKKPENSSCNPYANRVE